MRLVFTFFVLLVLLVNGGCDEWTETPSVTCDVYEFCFENSRDKKIAVYINDDHVSTLEPGEIECLGIEAGKHNVRVEKNQIIVFNRVLVDDWVDVEGSNCTTSWTID